MLNIKIERNNNQKQITNPFYNKSYVFRSMNKKTTEQVSYKLAALILGILKRSAVNLIGAEDISFPLKLSNASYCHITSPSDRRTMYKIDAQRYEESDLKIISILYSRESIADGRSDAQPQIINSLRF